MELKIILLPLLISVSSVVSQIPYFMPSRMVPRFGVRPFGLPMSPRPFGIPMSPYGRPFGIPMSPYGYRSMFPYRQPFPMGPARRFMPVYPRRSRDIVPLGPPRNANPYSIRPVGFNPLSGMRVPGGGATLILLDDGRKMVVPSAAGAARGQRAMLLRRDSAIAGAIPVTNRVAARLHNTVAPGIGHKRFRVMGLLPERATSMLARAASRTPLIRSFNPMIGRFY